LYLILAGTERFLVEFIRRNNDVLIGLTQPQLLSLLMIAGGAVWLLVRRPVAAPAPARA
jgi:phosphatidylglycerol---prolipoprotein diacylglyceryl transferase